MKNLTLLSLILMVLSFLISYGEDSKGDSHNILVSHEGPIFESLYPDRYPEVPGHMPGRILFSEGLMRLLTREGALQMAGGNAFATMNPTGPFTRCLNIR